jgi:hypothetical protein
MKVEDINRCKRSSSAYCPEYHDQNENKMVGEGGTVGVRIPTGQEYSPYLDTKNSAKYLVFVQVGSRFYANVVFCAFDTQAG